MQSNITFVSFLMNNTSLTNLNRPLTPFNQTTKYLYILNNQTMNKELIQDAIDCYGKNLVSEVISLVQMADADGCYSMFQDMDMPDHAEIVEMLYFQ
jgi:hypothetical protein